MAKMAKAAANEANEANGQAGVNKRSVAVIVVVVVLLAIAVGVWAALQLCPAYYAVVHDGDGGVLQLDLAQDKTVRVETSLGVNVVQVKDGAVSVVEADCPNHNCMDQGAVSHVGDQIICLPHKLWIDVVSNAQETDQSAPDVISK